MAKDTSEIKVEVDLSSIKTMRDFNQLQRDIFAAQAHVPSAKDGETPVEKIFRIYARYITGWSLQGDPTAWDTFNNLTPKQWREVQGQVTDALTTFFQG